MKHQSETNHIQKTQTSHSHTSFNWYTPPVTRNFHTFSYFFFQVNKI
jgi:hypothetical protein